MSRFCFIRSYIDCVEIAFASALGMFAVPLPYAKTYGVESFFF